MFSTAMKKKISTKLSSRQRMTTIRVSIVLIVIALLWIIFSPQTGCYALFKQQDYLQSLQEKTIDLQAENKQIQRENNRLINDPEYIEKVAREKQGLLKKNERVYDFSQ